MALFVSADGTMMAAGFDPVSGRPKGMPQPLFPARLSTGINRPYAVDSKGARFLLTTFASPQLVAVMDWQTLRNPGTSQ